MATKLTLYGIGTCDGCRKAKAWLEGRGHEAGPGYAWVDLREGPPSAARVRRWVKALGSKPLRNTSGKAYRALGAERDGWSDAEWARAFAADPMLIKRPVLEFDGEPVAVGFKPAAWSELLSDR